MVSAVQSRQRDADAHPLERLRRGYEDRGFSFIIEPDDTALPNFLVPCRPDAIAQKAGENIAIKVRKRPGFGLDGTLADIRKRLSEHPGWRLDVVYLQAEPLGSVAVARVDMATLRRKIAELRQLNASGQSQAAFVMSWSLLEAASNLLGGEASNQPKSAGQVVQWLAMNGYVDMTSEARLRTLAELRSRIVHGGVDVEATTGEVDEMLAAVEQALNPDPA